MIEYQKEDQVSAEEFKQILIKSTLGERRPVDDHERIRHMIRNANLVITARHQGKLVGIARSISDFVYCTYLSDLAVDQEFQGMGIGKELIRQTKQASPEAKLILLSAPKAEEYYPAIGMLKHENCYFLDNIHELK